MWENHPNVISLVSEKNFKEEGFRWIDWSICRSKRNEDTKQIGSKIIDLTMVLYHSKQELKKGEIGNWWLISGKWLIPLLWDNYIIKSFYCIYLEECDLAHGTAKSYLVVSHVTVVFTLVLKKCERSLWSLVHCLLQKSNSRDQPQRKVTINHRSINFQSWKGLFMEPYYEAQRG